MAHYTERAWAAGFFDGEGSIGFYDKGIRISIQQNYPQVLERWVKAVGVGKVHGPYGPYLVRGKMTNPIYQVQIHKCSDIEHALQMMWPFLSQIKREQAELSMAYQFGYVS